MQANDSRFDKKEKKHKTESKMLFTVEIMVSVV